MDFFHAHFRAIKSSSKREELKAKGINASSAHGKFQYDARQGDNPQKHPDELLHTEFGNIPKIFKNAGDFFKASDELERKNGVPARTLEVSLPVELSSSEQKIELSRAIAHAVAVAASDDPDKPLPWHFAIHDADPNPKKEKNPHVHIMLSERMYDSNKEDFYSEKPKNFFTRHNPKTNFFRAPRAGKSSRSENLTQLRGVIADTINNHLARAGFDETHFVSHLSYAARGIDKEPGMHIGRDGHAMASGRTTKRIEKLAENKETKKIAELALGAKKQVLNHEQGIFAKLKIKAEARLSATPYFKDERDFLYRHKSYKTAATANKTAYQKLKKKNQELAELQSRPPGLVAALGEWFAVRALNMGALLVGSDKRFGTQTEVLEAARQAARAAYHEQQATKTSLAATKAAIEKRYGATASQIVAQSRNQRAEIKDSLQAYADGARGKMDTLNAWLKTAGEAHNITLALEKWGRGFQATEPGTGARATTLLSRDQLVERLAALDLVLGDDNKITDSDGREVGSFDTESRFIELQTVAHDKEFFDHAAELQLAHIQVERDGGRAYKTASQLSEQSNGAISRSSLQYVNDMEKQNYKNSIDFSCRI